MNPPTCRLCGVTLTDTNRCKSHILPDSMVREVAGDEYGSTINVLGGGLEKRLKRRKGSYDANILCAPCDGDILAVYDKSGIEFIRSAKLIPVEFNGSHFWRVEGIDKAKLKLFLLSYIWRASITTLPEFHGAFLGPKHEEKIKNMLLAGDAGCPDDYGVVITRFSGSTKPVGAALYPQQIKIKGYYFHQASLPNLYRFLVKTDSKPHPNLIVSGLGAYPDVLVSNQGLFEASRDYRNLVDMVMKDVARSRK